MSANMNWFAWWSRIGWPKVLRTAEYSSASSIAPRAIPIAWPAIPIRPPSSVLIAILKPSPSFPRRFFAGTRQSSRKIVQEYAALMPIFLSGGARLKPGASVGMMKAEMPRCPAALSVIANKTIASGFGLGQPEAPELLPAGEGNQKLALLRLVAKFQHRIAVERVVDAHDHAGR